MADENEKNPEASDASSSGGEEEISQEELERRERVRKRRERLRRQRGKDKEDAAQETDESAEAADEEPAKKEAPAAQADEDDEDISEEERARRERVRQRRERLRRLKDRGELGAGGAGAAASGGGDDKSGADNEAKERKAAEKVGKPARERRGGSRKARMAQQRAAAKDEPIADDSDAKTMTRRQVIRLSMWGSIMLFFAANGLAFLNFFWPRGVGAFGGEIVLGRLQEILQDLGVGRARRIDAGQMYLVRLAEDRLIALWWVCPHLGCTVPPMDDRGLFVCPCHGSTYDTNGQILHGPAPRPMDKMELKVDGDNLVVDTGNISQRSRHQEDHEFRIEV